MQVVIISAVIASLVALDAASRAESAWLVLLAGVLYVAIAALLAWISAVMAVAHMRCRHETDRPGKRRYRLAAVAAHLWLIAGSPALIALGYGHMLLDELSLDAVPLAGELLALAPLVLAVLVQWVFEYPAHREMRTSLAASAAWQGLSCVPVWTRREYLTYNLRHHLLFIIVPISLITLAKDILLLPTVVDLLPEEVASYVIPGAIFVAAAGVMLLVPHIIVRIWRTERLADGPLRDELESLCARLGLRFREVLVWRSGGVIANAAVVGLLPRARYVLLSDALLDNFSTDQIRAIFAHEATHILQHHIFYAVLFVMTSVTLCTTGAAALAQWLGWGQWLGEIAGMLLAVAALAFGFGWLSRRFERQSDVTAAMLSAPPDYGDADDGEHITLAGANIFAGALERIAWINGMDPRARNWRHGPISWRVAHVLSLAQRNGATGEINRVVRRAKAALWMLLALVIAIIAWDLHQHAS